jgi:chloramphenicol 3-O-phosphotransferase
MHVILLNGAIASGKSTLGRAIVEQRSQYHRAAIFYDVDDEVRKVNPRLEWEHGEERLKDWLHSRKHSALSAAEDLRKGREVVVAGPFFLKEEIIGYIDFIPRDTPLFLYTLVTSFEERVRRDTARTHRNTFSDLCRQQEKIDHLPKQYGYEVQNTGPVEETIRTILHLVTTDVGRLDRRSLNGLESDT